MGASDKPSQGPQGTALKEIQGRWFEMQNAEAKPNGNQGTGTEVAWAESTVDQRGNGLREGLSLIQRLPVGAREQLFDQFLASVSAQFNGTITVSQPPINEDRRQRNIDVFYKYIEYENARDYENMERLFHPTEFRSKTYFGNDPISPKAHTRMLRGLFRAFPDWFMVINRSSPRTTRLLSVSSPGAVRSTRSSPADRRVTTRSRFPRCTRSRFGTT